MQFKCVLAVVLAKKKMRMVDLVHKTGVDFHTVSRYYRGDNVKMINLAVVAKFCEALDCDIGDLFIVE